MIESKKVEVLAAGEAVVNQTGEKIVLVTLRMDPQASFRPTNIVLTMNQACRLHRELGMAIQRNMMSLSQERS